MSVFYERFLRHDNGAGLKGHSTHYCPGCGHGLVHKLLAEAIEALGVQDRTIAVSPVGCSVFLHYYLDVGNTQAAHGRAPAVALGHKLANPNSIVISYQGDGDLASIGIAEILHAAQLGAPITVVFVNNAVYGMTGGQMAPTTLMGQHTTTSPRGRDAFMGQPLRMAELIAGLDGPVYVERVALFDTKQRVKAQKAITKALRLQVEDRGFSFVEVLAECPTHLKLTPEQTERWVKEQMLPVFPLGVKKDVAAAQWPAWPTPSFEPVTLIEALAARPRNGQHGRAVFPRARFGADVGFKLTGAGGDGAQTAALLLAKAAIQHGFDATHIPSYGPESRGGTSYADVRVAEREVLSPAVPAPHALLAFNAPSLAKFAATVLPRGVVVYDSSVVPAPPSLAAGIRVFGVPCSEIAHGLGRLMVKNAVALGALQAATRLLPDAALIDALQAMLGRNPALLELNLRAFEAGRQAVLQLDAAAQAPIELTLCACPESQADGAPCPDATSNCDQCGRARPPELARWNA